MVKILCLHTAHIHQSTFGSLFNEEAPQIELTQIVRADWLEKARKMGLAPELKSQIGNYLVEQAAKFDAVLCTCSTLGPIADIARKQQRKIVRIDTALMATAVQHEGVVLVAMCLESTRAATIALIDQAFAEAGKGSNFRVVLCSDAWPFFERGEMQEFALSITEKITATAAETKPVGCIILAQASMAVAEPLLKGVGVPVYSSPRLAVKETVRVAQLG